MKLFLRNDIWWVSHGTGKNRIRQSTGKTDKAEAEQVAREICAPAMLRKEADIVEMAGKIASGKRKDAKARAAEMVPLSECYEKYPLLKNDGSEPAAGSKRIDKRVWRRFVEFCESIGVHLVHEVTSEVAEAYLKTVLEGSRELAYCYCRIRFKAMGVEDNPFGRKPKRDKRKQKHREPLTRPEVRQILAALDEKIWYAPPNGASNEEFALYVRFLVYTGLRIGDAATMKVSQCDFERRMLKRVSQKTGKEVEFPMFRVLYDSLPRAGDYIFPMLARTCSHGMTTQISTRFRKVFKRLGMYRGNGVICAHSFRHTFGTICCEEGIPLVVVQDWLGHSSPAITRIYTHYNDIQRKKQIVEKFPEF